MPKIDVEVGIALVGELHSDGQAAPSADVRA